jgi:hypothetical protein
LELTNVFIVFTSAHIFHAQNIIRTYGMSEYVFVCTNRSLALELDDQTTVISLGGIFPFDLIALLRCKAIFGRLQKDVRLFVPHFLNVASQALYYFLEARGVLRETCILPDGNLLFNAYTVTKRSLGNILRKVKSVILLSKYCLLEGDICSIGKQDIYVYSYIDNTRYSEDPKFTVRSIGMPIADIKRSSGLLILGHFNQKMLDTEVLCESISSLLNENIVVYYKPHPRIKLNNDLFYKAIKKRTDSVNLIANKASIEKILNKYRDLDTVFAVGSSSLINMKLMYPSLEVYCCALQEYFGNFFDQKLKENFDKLKITELPYIDN